MEKKLRSVDLSIQDVVLKDGVTVVAIHGGIVIDTGEKKMNEKLDQWEPVLQKINFRVPIEEYPNIKGFFEEIKSMTNEALTLKEIKLMEEQGFMAMMNKPTPKKRVSKTRNKKK